MYVDAWRKHRDRAPLQPLEAQIADVVSLHPEYHALLEAGGESIDHDWSPEAGETNPFLHMGMHLAIREQVATNRPTGIMSIHETLVSRSGDVHLAEHLMMEVLAETLWRAQRDGGPPDEATYLLALRRL
jgi:hypothetical protein